MSSKTYTQKKLELDLCQASASQGIGTIYERIVLSRLFHSLHRQYSFKSILELGAGITRGWDNLYWLQQNLKVSIADSNSEHLSSIWPKTWKKPRFTPLAKSAKAELVWNFAQIHLKPSLINIMIQKSNQYILIFTPNLYNWGAPIHAFFHLITQTKCRHPERGSRPLRTIKGVEKIVKSQGLKIVKVGFIDKPIWPDFAFSKQELLKSLEKKPSKKSKPQFKNSELNSKINLQTKILESKNLPSQVQSIIAHHQYVLASK